MDRKNFLLWEKAQVLLTAGVLLAAVYYLLWRSFVGADPQGPMVFLPAGRFGAMLLAGVMLCLLGAIAGLTTTRSRPAGAILAALLAAGGLALRSPQMKPLLWIRSGHLGSLFGQMILEILFFAAVLFLATVLARVTRGFVRRFKPSWVWSDPLTALGPEHRKALSKAGIVSLPSQGETGENTAHVSRAELRRSLACLFSGVAMGIILVSIIMQSTLRGQVLFALLAGFYLAALGARHFFPARSVAVAWAMPLVVAIIFYILAAISASGSPTGFWASAGPQFQALPIDWLSAGGSGAVLGFWTAGRMLELRAFEHLISLEVD